MYLKGFQENTNSQWLQIKRKTVAITSTWSDFPLKRKSNLTSFVPVNSKTAHPQANDSR